MVDLVEFLDSHSGAMQAVATVALIGITGWYTLLTRNLARSAREAQRPYVYADIGSEGGPQIEFIIANEGERAAQRITLKVEVTGSGQEVADQLASLHPFKGGISYLAPHRRYRYQMFLTDLSIFDDDRADHVVLELAVKYHDETRSYSEAFSIDLTALSGVGLSSFSDPSEQIARQMKELVRVQKQGISRAARSTRSPTNPPG